ncbi:hypothetical protein HED60_08355 [Planctomycetales bacterium ZRK34]|nr:hypothetical protein HED60_08355 [Planctomycetales bacterium ZRK34]
MKYLAALVCVVGLLGGCSSFERDWEVAGESPTPTDAITGRWTGTWQSDVNQHTGELRAIITPIDKDTYQARYHATWGGWLSGEYTTDLQVTGRDGGRVQFESSKDLGWLYGGVYHMTGHATPTEFISHYKSEHDHGTYTLNRPQ